MNKSNPEIGKAARLERLLTIANMLYPEISWSLARCGDREPCVQGLRWVARMRLQIEVTWDERDSEYDFTVTWNGSTLASESHYDELQVIGCALDDTLDALKRACDFLKPLSDRSVLAGSNRPLAAWFRRHNAA